jgi:hypothetical protein
VDQDGAGAVIDQAIAAKDRLGIEAVWLQLCVIDEPPPSAPTTWPGCRHEHMPPWNHSA